MEEKWATRQKLSSLLMSADHVEDSHVTQQDPTRDDKHKHNSWMTKMNIGYVGTSFRAMTEAGKKVPNNCSDRILTKAVIEVLTSLCGNLLEIS